MCSGGLGGLKSDLGKTVGNFQSGGHGQKAWGYGGCNGTELSWRYTVFPGHFVPPRGGGGR